MGKISDYFLDIRNKFTSKNDVKRFTLNYSKAKNVGILFDIKNEDQYTILNDFVSMLRGDGKHVELLTYFDFDKMHSNPFSFQFDFFTKKDINVLGSIHSYQVDNFVEQDFDYLYCIFLEPFLPFDNILLRSKAKCRIGKYFENKEDFFELMIHLPETAVIDDLIDQMFTYTKKLNLV